jgi:aconitate hydratase
VTAYALAGSLDFNPLTDEIEVDGGKMRLDPPKGDELPSSGFIFDRTGFIEGNGKGEVDINPDSDRLAFLEVFGSWDKAKDFNDMFVLVKAKGKCTTDHVSPAGPWLKYRGHLDKISDNMYTGAVNAFSDKVGEGKDILTGKDESYPAIARNYKKNGKGWVVIGDSNYGEGSSREHAAMEPRYLGCRAVIAKSFARIAETNLKKQGLLPLWFANENDYDKILEDDMISFLDLDIKPGEEIGVEIKHADGAIEVIKTKHTFSDEQIRWFEQGSALSFIRKTHADS